MITINSLKAPKTRKSRRVGRGPGSGRGTYAGRGLKGQKARSGGRGGLKLMGLKQTFHKIPKIRGFVSPYAKLKIINLDDLTKKYQEGSEVKLPGYKVLAKGQLTKKLIICASSYSKKAQEAIIKAGGEAKPCGKK